MALRLKDGRGQAQMDVPHCAVWTAGLGSGFCTVWRSNRLPWAVSLGAHPYLAAEQQQQEGEEMWPLRSGGAAHRRTDRERAI